MSSHPRKHSHTPSAQTPPIQPSGDQLQALPTPELQKRLHTSPNGLTQAEVQRRLAQYGYNELIEKKVSPLRKLLSYFWGPIPWMIETAIFLSAILGHVTDLLIISALLLTNAVVGFWEEFQASNAVEALKSRLALNATVKRDGKWVTIPARELVPGDIIRLRLGEIVPADARLLESLPVEVDQSALTGESLPVTRTPGEDVYLVHPACADPGHRCVGHAGTGLDHCRLWSAHSQH